MKDRKKEKTPKKTKEDKLKQAKGGSKAPQDVYEEDKYPSVEGYISPDRWL